MTTTTVEQLIKHLNLKPHPEGGYYTETFRDTFEVNPGRAASTAIYFLLGRGDRSHWHRVMDAVEIFHYYSGAPLAMQIAASADGPVEHLVCGPDPTAGQRPQVVIPATHWQSCESMGDWTLVGCTVAPGFVFEKFELAPKGWAPGQ